MIDVLIIGGGPAGAALAIHLSRAGRHVVLLERERGPNDKVCGDFLSGETLTGLRSLGLEVAALGAIAVEAVSICRANAAVTVALPFPASSLSRRCLDDGLLRAASCAGAEVQRGVAVTAVRGSVGEWGAELADGRVITTRAVFLATGKHDLPGRARGSGKQGDLVAFKAYWRLSPQQAAAMGHRVELHLFDRVYAGFQPVEGDRANLCFLIGRGALKAAGRAWPSLLARVRQACPQLDARLMDAEPIGDRPLVLAGLPYGFVRERSDGPWHLGDQAAVIPSFSGDGLALALYSAALASEAYLAGRSADSYQRQFANHVGLQVRWATWLSRALVSPPTQHAVLALARRFPPLVQAVARSTRLSPAAASG